MLVYTGLYETKPSKCKYMVLSRKRSPMLPVAQLTILDIPLDRVSEFKYLGVWLTDNLSWSKHIQSITKKAMKLVSVVYRKFYRHSSTETLKKLYISLIRPHLEYASPVWDPHCVSQIGVLEKVQKFSLRMCLKAWNIPYDSILERTALPSLEKRRKLLKLIFLFQILNGSYLFPNVPVTSQSMDKRLRNFHPTILNQPFARTIAYRFSFFPDIVSVWNSLPLELRTISSLPVFKQNVVNYL